VQQNQQLWERVGMLEALLSASDRECRQLQVGVVCGATALHSTSMALDDQAAHCTLPSLCHCHVAGRQPKLAGASVGCSWGWGREQRRPQGPPAHLWPQWQPRVLHWVRFGGPVQPQ
jgi:hypothetical protein